MRREEIRNIAIIAHVDHGKTTLVDQLLKQSGQFRKGELVGECILDSNPLERERGITILAKNCAIVYTDRNGNEYQINIVDTPGHADFSGEVERVLMMADGVLLLVDAFEGAMPQTRYVLSKALALNLPPVLVINKMDRQEIRPDEVEEEIFDLLAELGDEQAALDFPTLYASARLGWVVENLKDVPADGVGDVHQLFDAIIRHIPAPEVQENGPTQTLITTIDYNDYVGRIGIGRVFGGELISGKEYSVISREGERTVQKIGQLFKFQGLGRKEVKKVQAGDICAVVGLGRVDIGDTITSLESPVALPPVHVDEPTLHMTFRINDGPFSGQDGSYVTSRQLRDRLQYELQSNVALRVEDRESEFMVSGRGLLHLGILLENMRREGFELTVGKPQVVYKTIDGVRHEPMEHLVMDLPIEHQGAAMQILGNRRAELMASEVKGDRAYMEFIVPSRGLIGFAGRVLTATQGEAIMHHRFVEYGPYRGPIGGRANGVMIATETGQVTAYALDQLADRGIMFVEPGDQVYMGQVVGEHCKTNDIPVNVVRQKKLTNIRSSTKDATVVLKAARRMSLEAALEYIEGDELVELTPKTIRLRKYFLVESDRRRLAKRNESGEV